MVHSWLLPCSSSAPCCLSAEVVLVDLQVGHLRRALVLSLSSSMADLLIYEVLKVGACQPQSDAQVEEGSSYHFWRGFYVWKDQGLLQGCHRYYWEAC